MSPRRKITIVTAIIIPIISFLFIDLITLPKAY